MDEHSTSARARGRGSDSIPWRSRPPGGQPLLSASCRPLEGWPIAERGRTMARADRAEAARDERHRVVAAKPQRPPAPLADACPTDLAGTSPTHRPGLELSRSAPRIGDVPRCRSGAARCPHVRPLVFLTDRRRPRVVTSRRPATVGGVAVTGPSGSWYLAATRDRRGLHHGSGVAGDCTGLAVLAAATPPCERSG